MIPRQVIKTIEAIRDPTTVNIKTKRWVRVLEALGFEWSAGEHQNWRHPEGYRHTLWHNPEPVLYGWKIKEMRTLLDEMERNNHMAVPIQSERVDTTALKERRLQEQQAGNVGNFPTITMKALHDSLQEIKERLGSLKSIEDLLLDLGSKIEGGVGPGVAKPKMTKGEVLAANRDKAMEAKKHKVLKAIKEAQAEYPNIKKDTQLAVLAGVSLVTLKKYKEQGLV